MRTQAAIQIGEVGTTREAINSVPETIITILAHNGFQSRAIFARHSGEARRRDFIKYGLPFGNFRGKRFCVLLPSPGPMDNVACADHNFHAGPGLIDRFIVQWNDESVVELDKLDDVNLSSVGLGLSSRVQTAGFVAGRCGPCRLDGSVEDNPVRRFHATNGDVDFWTPEK